TLFRSGGGCSACSLIDGPPHRGAEPAEEVPDDGKGRGRPLTGVPEQPQCVSAPHLAPVSALRELPALLRCVLREAGLGTFVVHQCRMECVDESRTRPDEAPCAE